MILRAVPGDAPTISVDLAAWGALLLDNEAYADAEMLFRTALQIRTNSQLSADSPQSTEIVEQLVELYDRWGRPEKAAEYRAKLGVGE